MKRKVARLILSAAGLLVTGDLRAQLPNVLGAVRKAAAKNETSSAAPTPAEAPTAAKAPDSTGQPAPKLSEIPATPAPAHTSDIQKTATPPFAKESAGQKAASQAESQ